MKTSAFFALLATSLWSVSAAPSAADLEKRKAGLRLIKTAPKDAGRWVTEEEKITIYHSKDIGFVDITDIKDSDVLRILSTPDGEDTFSAQAVTYPTAVSRQSQVNALLPLVSTTQPQSWLTSLTNFYNRHYKSTYGTQAGDWLFNTVKSVASVNSAITVTKFTHSGWNQPSIIAKIPGNSTNLVIVSAHYDSTGGSSSAKSPGADDNGSGVVVILEALRVLANNKFKGKDTLEFHFYAAEEGGLLGSAAVFANYKSTGKTVLAVVNQDMAGYSPSGKISIYTDYVDSSLTAYTRVVATAYTGATTSDKCGYGCSDHASARSNGFPAAYVCDEPIKTSTPYIHTANDALSTIQWPTILRHAKFTVAFLVEASYL
ncbi:putative aminopeptidase [Podospora fimiseda]|uniref:Peptide hydrolase n=1 Tax=Podospora fimiseda TaxID=252190 RepID=A0AAN7BI76_9PEZI|nr:putative aminopeptidase [Podospora fimiseda]